MSQPSKQNPKPLPTTIDAALDPQDRKRITEAMQRFQQTYNHGYKILMDELAKMHPTTAQNKDPLKPFRANMTNLKMLDSPESFAKFMKEGKPISELLGFSPEVIDKFYEVAYQILQQKRFKDAKDVFFFLVTIAPQVSECWLGLGYAYGHCEEPEGAIQSYLRAIALSPHKADGYLAFARLCTAIQDFNRANKVCDIGMNFVHQHQNQPWAQELGNLLQEAKKQITQLAN